MSFERIQLPKINMPSSVLPRDLSNYKCWYCLDRHFVFVNAKWFSGALPESFTKDEITACLKPSYRNYAVPCDCCTGHAKTFVHIFGISISRTNYGRALVAIRDGSFAEPKELPSLDQTLEKMTLNTEMGMN